MTSRGRAVLSLLVGLPLALAANVSPARGGEMIVQGQVVDVVPLSDSGNSAGRASCQPPKPGAGADLVALLAWDLRTECSGALPAARVSAYRVYYRWDGRTYSQVMSEPPGETVSLRVRVR